MIVWIASYPRSGNTFTRILLKSVFGLNSYSIHDDALISTETNFKEIVGHSGAVQASKFDEYRERKEVCLIKTHNVPAVRQGDKIIYLIRDGRDAIYSYFKYKTNIDKTDISLVDIIKGNVFFGKWSSHYENWKPYLSDNSLVLHFEKLVKEPLNYLYPLSRLIGKKPVSTNIPEFADLQSVNRSFFRKGIAGEWKDHFTDDIHLLFWLLHFRAMHDNNYNNDVPVFFSKFIHSEFSKIIDIINEPG